MQVGARNARALERSQCLAAVKARGVVDEGEHVLGEAQIFEHGVAHAAHRRHGHQAFLDAAGQKTQQRGVDEQVHSRRVRGAAENVEHVADTVAHRVNQMKAPLGDACLVADGVQRIHHVIHWHDVHAPAFQAHRRHPGRQYLAHALDQLEEIVRSVDLVHLARLAVAHHHGGPKYRPGQLAFFANNFFALVLGAKVRVVQAFGFLEHVFAEHAFVQAGGGDGRHMVKMPSVNRLGKFHGVARAVDIYRYLAFLIGRQVVHRGQMVEMVDLALQPLDVFRGHAQAFGLEVAKHRHRPCRADTPVAAQLGHLVLALATQEKVHH